MNVYRLKIDRSLFPLNNEKRKKKITYTVLHAYIYFVLFISKNIFVIRSTKHDYSSLRVRDRVNETVSFCAVRTRCNGPFKTVDLLGEALKLANYLWLQCIASGADIGHMCTLPVPDQWFNSVCKMKKKEKWAYETNRCGTPSSFSIQFAISNWVRVRAMIKTGTLISMAIILI